MSVSADITKTEEFKNCFSMLQHLSKDDLLKKINAVSEKTEFSWLNHQIKQFIYYFYNLQLSDVLSANKLAESLADVPQKLQEFHETIEKSDLQKIVSVASPSPPKAETTSNVKSRVAAVVSFWFILKDRYNVEILNLYFLNLSIIFQMNASTPKNRSEFLKVIIFIFSLSFC